MFDVLTIGAANTDFFFNVKTLPAVDEEVEAGSIDKKLGGSAANFAVGCSKLNLKTSFLGCIGLDSEGDELMQEFKNSGVDVSFVKRLKARTGRFVVMVDEDANKKMTVFVGANNLLSKKMIPVKAIKSAKFLHITSLSSDSAFEALLFAKTIAKENGLLVSIDPGHILSEMGLEKLHDLLEGVDFIFPSKLGLEKLTGFADVETACSTLSGLVKTIVVTLGNEGCFVYSGGKGFLVKPSNAQVLDTTGAGDAFAAAFVYGVLKDKSLRESAVLANKAAGISIGGKGARSAQVFEKDLLVK